MKKTREVTLFVHPGGNVETIYQDGLKKLGLGRLHTRRASVIEFNDAGQVWEVRAPKYKGMPPELWPVIHEHESREECLEWERDWLNKKLKQPTQQSDMRPSWQKFRGISD